MMTDTQVDLKGARSQKPFVQIPKELIQYVRTLKLTGTQYELWLYLWELDPFGDRWVEIPPPQEIAILLGVDARTVQRAAQRLSDCELFDIKITNWKARNTTVSVKTKDFSTGKGIRVPTKRSRDQKGDRLVGNGIGLSPAGQNDPNDEPEPLQAKAFSSPHTIHTSSDPLIDQVEREREGDEPVQELPEECFELTENELPKITPAYAGWLRSKAKQFREPVVLIERWIESESLKWANQKQFLQELRQTRQTRDRVHVPPLGAEPIFQPNEASPEETPEQRLHRLRAMWQAENLRGFIQRAIASHPEWGLAIVQGQILEVGHDN